MRILVYPNPLLTRKTQPVKQFTKELKGIIRRMLDTMYRANGVGLAANQVGYPYAIAVINITRKPADELVLINPKIVKSEGLMMEPEGCLSCPGIEVTAKRAARLVCEALDPAGKKVLLKADELLARAVQHEIDHLNGILIVDKLSGEEKQKAITQLTTKQK
ncbi:MAG: peptide deformylase [Planctomycetes bacterium]|nr:peptide deformylase [Planctomycetota bacterium]